MFIKHALIFLFLIVMLFLPGGTAMGAQPNSMITSLDPQDLGQFVDAFFAEKMDALNVPGAAIVLVQGAQPLVARGYGFSNVTENQPASADTAFRAGSVSKLFTATAVMQLVEQGRIDLNADVNDYLTTFELKTSFPEPVTVADLLLHTAGFDEEYLGGHARTAADGQPLGDFLAQNMPPQTSPAGQFISYNDYTMSLAGYLVEEVSGMPFHDYIDKNIFLPLGMSSSTFSQPAPQQILDRLAVGYEMDGREMSPFDYDYINVSPAAALLTTANDMSGFLSAHLMNGGVLLNPESTADMHTTQFRQHPLLRGRAYGFSELFINGHRVLFHDGGNPGFGNRLMLLPDEGIGFYITFNMDQFERGGKLHREFTTAFFDRYFPAESIYTPPVPADIRVENSRYTGYYREMQAYSSNTIQKIASLLNHFPVRTTENGELFTAGSSMIPVEKDLFAWQDVDGFVAFREDESGKISHMFFGTGVFVKLKWYEAQPFHLALAGLFVLTFLGAAISGLFPAVGKTAGLLRPLLSITGGLNLLFLIGFGILMMQTSQWEFTYGIPAGVKGLLAIPLVTMMLVLVIFGLTLAGWNHGDLAAGVRILLVSVLMISIGFYIFLDYWNLLGWRG